MSDFVKVAAHSDVAPGTMLGFEIDGDTRVLVHTEGGELRALDGICTHEDAFLAEGDLEGTTLWCPLHAAGFDVENGEPICLPASVALGRYDVRVEGDDILVSRAAIS